MPVDSCEAALGTRSWRYSMLVNDGRIEKMFIEPHDPGDPFKFSDAETMLKARATEPKQPARSQSSCSRGTAADIAGEGKQMLERALALPSKRCTFGDESSMSAE